ncbi:MAG: glucosamine-6-phosphate deaminase [Oscillospiraceae bacterium]|jgi:glucosamine-6-phosphate deaminase|nr:glucosamine-6-phosphate deaminase [Oscillospiraceae bacterium]
MTALKATDYKNLSMRAAIVIAAQILANPRCVLGFATGGTPEGIYAELVSMYKDGLLDFSRVTTFNLDEYYPIDPAHGQSYHRYMREKLFDHVNINPGNTFIPNGLAADPESECREYEAKLKGAGGIDLQLLGIGRNGHIGFNEPHCVFSGFTGVVTLTEDTRAANARFFSDAGQVPAQAITMGVEQIMRSRAILLCAHGKSKQSALEKLFTGPIDPRLPASALRFHNNALVIYCD